MEKEMADEENGTNDDPVKGLENSVFNVHAQMDAMEKFIARRFDEISMEINATSQQFDMAEAGFEGSFQAIMEILGAISHTGEGNTPANTGVELENVIADTERAAVTIMDAVDRMTVVLDDKASWDEKESRDANLEKIRADVSDILLACSFQDLTGQRIRNTLDNLNSIEDRLSSTLDRLGINIDAEEVSKGRSEKVQAGSSQGDIDALFD
jgi:hypothetical protein